MMQLQSVPQWLLEPYGAPCPSTSEVSRCVGYYSVEALVAFGTAICR